MDAIGGLAPRWRGSRRSINERQRKNGLFAYPQGKAGRARRAAMQDSTVSSGSIAFLGFGEAARAFLDGWRASARFQARVSAYDI
jgi:hypothetical protein